MDTTDNSFFSKDIVKNISPKGDMTIPTSKVNRNMVLNFIREHSPITKYSLAKKLGLSYTSTSTIIKEFEFCGLVKVKVVLGENNRTHALVYIPESEVKNE